MIDSIYPKISFDKILTKIDRKFTIDDIEEYSCVGLRLYGKGAFVREIKAGIEIKRKQQWLLKSGDVLYNKLFAWKGTFAIASSEMDGCIVSDKFPTYKLNEDLIRPEFLQFWFKSPQLAHQAYTLSRGAAALSKLTLNPPKFWELEIPLPPLDEQDQIVEKLTTILKKVERILELREPIDAVVQGRRSSYGSEVRLLMTAALHRLNEKMDGQLDILDNALVMRPRSGPSFPCSEDGTGRAIIMPSALGGFRYDSSKHLYGDGTESISEKDILKPGDLLISRGNKRDQVGLCIVYESEEPRTYANLLMRMQVSRDKWIPKFVKYWIMSPLAVNYIRKNTKGTSPSVQKINQRALINMPFPESMPKTSQKKWIDYLDSMFERVERIESLIQKQYPDIKSLEPSFITAAFKGELLYY